MQRNAFRVNENPSPRSSVASRIIRCAAVLLMTMGALSAQSLTIVTGSLSDAMGITSTNKLSATCSFAATQSFVAASGWVVAPAVKHVIPVTAGILSVSLVPVDTATPLGASWAMTCHVPLQTADGRNCEGNASLVSQGVCVVGPTDWGPVYLLVPTSGTPVDLKDIYRTRRPTGLTWQQLLTNGTTWGQLLSGR